MLANGRRLGAHLPLGHGMLRAADRAAAIGVDAIQVFTDNPTSWRRRPTLPRELPAFRDRLAAAGIAPLVVHAPYLVNLAAPEPDVFDRCDRGPRERAPRRRGVGRGGRQRPPRLAPRLGGGRRHPPVRRRPVPGARDGRRRRAGRHAGPRERLRCRVRDRVERRGARRRSRRRSSRRASGASGSPTASTWPTSGARATPWTSRPASTRWCRRSTSRSAWTGCAWCTSTTPARSGARTPTATSTWARG